MSSSASSPMRRIARGVSSRPAVALAQVAALFQAAAHVAQDQERLDALLAGQLAQLLERDLVELSLEQVARHLAEPLDLAHQLERLVERQVVAAAQHLAVARLEVLERAQLVELALEVAEVGLGVGVGPVVVAEALQRLGQALGRLSFFAWKSDQGFDSTPCCSLCARSSRSRMSRSFCQRSSKVWSMLLPLMRSRARRRSSCRSSSTPITRKSMPASFEALVAHPGERLLDAHPLHQVAGELVERLLGGERERALRAVPAAVAQARGGHPYRQSAARDLAG